jgi:cytochrome b6-f complex iron-sulfur subunit
MSGPEGSDTIALSPLPAAGTASEPDTEEAPKSEAQDRRVFISRCWRALGWGGLGAMVAGSCAATLRFFYPRVLYEPQSWFVAGPPETFTVGEVSERFVASQRVWVVRTRAGIYALSARCTHLGCSPSWFAEERLFKCPCHGSNFDLAGDVVAGPAPQPLHRVSLRLGDDGQIVVDRALAENQPRAREGRAFLLRL